MFLAKTLASPSDNAASRAATRNSTYILPRPHTQSSAHTHQYPCMSDRSLLCVIWHFQAATHPHLPAYIRPIPSAHCSFSPFSTSLHSAGDHLVKSPVRTIQTLPQCLRRRHRFNHKRPHEKIRSRETIQCLQMPYAPTPATQKYARITSAFLINGSSVFSIAIPFARRSKSSQLKSFPPTLTRHCFPTSRGLLE